MSIVFKKSGRPSKEEKGLVSSINDLLRSVSDEERNIYSRKTYNTKSQLEDVLGVLRGSGKTKETIVKRKVEQPIEEIIEQPKTEKMIEEAIVESETTTNTQNSGIPDFFTPLADEVKQRSYNTDTPPPTSSAPIPEPSFTPPPSAKQTEDEAPKENPLDNVTNEALNDLDPKDKKMAVKQLVTTALDAYEMLHVFGVKMAQYDEGKMVDLVQKGKIDPSIELQVDEGVTATPMEYIQTFNQQASQAIKYDKEFGEKIRPAMERVFEKRGWGMTDEQYLLYAFGTDIAVKASMVIGMKKQQKMMINSLIQATASQNEVPVERVKPDTVEHPKPDRPVSAQKSEEDLADEDIPTSFTEAENIEKEMEEK